eukprot:m.70982 g.70982  ORF g.70982 m.70982 type:complete len:976 (+) comp12189_c0_seq3:69-2996(+)
MLAGVLRLLSSLVLGMLVAHDGRPFAILIAFLAVLIAFVYVSPTVYSVPVGKPFPVIGTAIFFLIGILLATVFMPYRLSGIEYEGEDVVSLEDGDSLAQWLALLHLRTVADKFDEAGIQSLDALESDSRWKEKVSLTQNQYSVIDVVLVQRVRARAMLKPLAEEHVKSLVTEIQLQTVEQKYAPSSFIVIFSVSALIAWYVLRLETAFRRGRERRRTWQESITGCYLDHVLSHVQGDFSPKPVGGIESFSVLHVQSNGLSHFCNDDSDHFNVAIMGPVSINFSVNKTADDTREVSFTTRCKGTYIVNVRLFGEHVTGSPFSWEFLPGPLDISRCSVEPSMVTSVRGTEYEASSLLPCISSNLAGLPAEVNVIARDKYDNLIPCAEESLFGLTLENKSLRSRSRKINRSPTMETIAEETPKGCKLHFQAEHPGVYEGNVVYRASPQMEWNILDQGFVTLLVVTQQEMKEITENVKNQGAWYEARQLSKGNSQNKLVYVYLQPAQIYIKSTWMRVFSWKSFSMRISPSSDFRLQDPLPNIEDNLEVFTLDDRSGSCITLASSKRNIIFATYSRFLDKRLGGSDNFEEKCGVFRERMRAEHGLPSNRETKLIRINRMAPTQEFLLDVMYKTRHVDWRKRWKIQFHDEEGLDYGGPTREFFHLLSQAIFSTQHKTPLFSCFDESGQGLVLPNRHSTNSNIPWEQMYRFAGRVVGKALFETAYGNSVYIPVQFARSFLAALLGLKAHYKYFETDDPELYQRKIQYIQDNDVSMLELTFVDPRVDGRGSFEDNIELKPGGANLIVTEENKGEFLNLLAYQRLEKSVREQTKQFLKGLHELVPDTLLSLFDENELELLICGVQDYDVMQMRAACSITYGGGETKEAFKKSLEWFWVVISNFTRDERISLLRFITGSGTLPPGGFKNLKPKLAIMYSGSHNSLPSSHTCFNQLCLPSYDSMEGLQRALETSITEGCEGFFGGL